MRDAIRRPFTIFDGLALIAAVAVALPPSRMIYTMMVQWAAGDRRFASLRTVELTTTLTALFLAIAGSTLILLSLLRPRPPMRRVLRQPGLVACVAAASAVVSNTALTLSRVYFKEWAVPGSRHLCTSWLNEHIDTDEMSAGAAVLGAWVVLAAARSWASEPNWIDRAGRVVGVGWLALYFWTWVRPWAEPFIPAL